MRARLFGFILAASATCALAVACSSFGGSEDEDDAAVTPDGAPASDVVPVDLPDGGPPPDGIAPPVEAGLDPATCPPAREPRCALGACDRRTVYTPPAPEFPFSITSDRDTLFWVAQPAGPADAYNGHAPARVLRVGKAAGSIAVEIASEQPRAMAIAVDGEHVYWGTFDTAGQGALLRARRDCAAPCTSEVAAAVPGKLVRLLRSAPGVLYGMTANGGVLHFDTTTPLPITATPVISVGDFPALAVTDTHAYAAAGNTSKVARVTPQLSSPTFASVPPPLDGGTFIGLLTLTTDCKSVWGARPNGPNQELLRFGIGGGAATGSTFFVGPFDTFNITADERYVYFANANAGGVVAHDSKVPNSRILIDTGNIFDLAVDGDGVYWGEHDNRNGQAGGIKMLVK